RYTTFKNRAGNIPHPLEANIFQAFVASLVSGRPLISSIDTKKSARGSCVTGALLGLAFLGAQSLAAQQAIGLSSPQAVGPTTQSFQGSIARGEATGQVLELSLGDAIQRGL